MGGKPEEPMTGGHQDRFMERDLLCPSHAGRFIAERGFCSWQWSGNEAVQKMSISILLFRGVFEILIPNSFYGGNLPEMDGFLTQKTKQTVCTSFSHLWVIQGHCYRSAGMQPCHGMGVRPATKPGWKSVLPCAGGHAAAEG